jgi:hypothetical protein
MASTKTPAQIKTNYVRLMGPHTGEAFAELMQGAARLHLKWNEFLALFAAGFIMAGRNRLACFGAREKGTCDNRLTIRRDEVEARVLKALEEKLLRQDLFDEFCEESTREMNRLRMEHRASLSAAAREIERIDARRKKLIEMGNGGRRLGNYDRLVQIKRRDDRRTCFD